MGDFGWAFLFFLWGEALSLPLRILLAKSPVPGDVRRVLSRVGGGPFLLILLWFAAHGTGFVLGAAFSTAWIILILWLSLRYSQADGRVGVADLMGYRRPWRRDLGLDLATLAMFMGMVAFRRWVPEMTTYVIDSSAAEKFMNAMIWWSTWHARDLPPDDYWLTGHPLTYYYWGHFYWSWVSRVGGFPATLALTLAFARMTAMGWEACYLSARSIGMRRLGGILAATAAAWGGNWVAAKAAWVWLKMGGGAAAYDFWGPSRAISNNVVDEFPAFSSVLGDFHSHQLGLPWAMAWLAVLIAGRRWCGRTRWPWAVVWATLGLAAALSNIWILPLMAFATVVALVCWSQTMKLVVPLNIAYAFACSVGLIFLIMIALMLMRGGEPLPLAEGAAGQQGILGRIPIKILPDLPELHSTFGQLWNLWGLGIVVFAAGAVARLILRRERRQVVWLVAGLLCFVPIFPNSALFIWIGVACLGWSLASGFKPWLSKRGAMALSGACAVLAGLEVFYIDDAMVGALERYNTYFKLSYPVWPVLMVAAAQLLAAACRISSVETRNVVTGWAWRAAAVVWFVALGSYLTLAIPSRIERARAGDNPPRKPTLNAFDFLAHRAPKTDDQLPYAVEAEMIRWIRANVPPGDVIAEAAWVKAGEMFVGGYDFHGRVASLSGRPIPLGWAHHEVQWRGVTGMTITAERQAALDRLYTAPTAAAMREAAAAVGARWVLYGVLEHDQYARRMGLGADVLQRLNEAGKLAAALPAGAPGVFLFDFRQEAEKMN